MYMDIYPLFVHLMADIVEHKKYTELNHSVFTSQNSSVIDTVQYLTVLFQ